MKLLQARLLTEGGYHERALTILQSIDESQLPVADKVEYLFRTARAWQEAGDNSKALAYYRSTIEMGKPWHSGLRPGQHCKPVSFTNGYGYVHKGYVDVQKVPGYAGT